MSVREINERFVGLRVQRKLASEAKPRIKNFSFRIPVRRQGVTAWREATEEERQKVFSMANALDAEWAELQRHNVGTRVLPFDPWSKRTNTGVKGIRYAWAPDSQGYMIEALWINVTVKGKTHAASVRLSTHSWNTAWASAVERLSTFKDLDDVTAAKIMKALPKAKALREPAPSKSVVEKTLATTRARRRANRTVR